MQPSPTASKPDDGERTTLKQKTIASKRKISHNVPDPLSERWMDKQVVLELLHISESTLQKWRKNGLLPFSRILGKIYYKESDILQLLEKCKKAKRA